MAYVKQQILRRRFSFILDATSDASPFPIRLLPWLSHPMRLVMVARLVKGIDRHDND